MELLLKFHWGVCVGPCRGLHAGRKLFRGWIFSRCLFPLMGDWRLVSELEDLDLLTGKKERLLGVEVFEDSFSLAAALQERGSRETCWEEFPKPSPSSASSLHWLLYLVALSTVFLARIVGLSQIGRPPSLFLSKRALEERESLVLGFCCCGGGLSRRRLGSAGWWMRSYCWSFSPAFFRAGSPLQF